MNATLLAERELAKPSGRAAEQTRRRLRDADVFAINLVGGPGCGKSTLIDATIERLNGELSVGIIACEIAAPESERALRHGAQLVQLHTHDRGVPDAREVHDALARLDLSRIDVLFIENVGTLVGPVAEDVGQSVTATIFSVAGGHDKPAKHPEVVRHADVVLLNKTDLLRAVPFELDTFRREVQRLNPSAPLCELCALRGEGIESWVRWLERQAARKAASASRWFG